MQKGDVLEVKIESVGMDGEGIAKQDGMVIFVPFTLVGEKVKCEITFVKKSFATAKVIKLLQGSSFRVQPLCLHFRRCGGCDMQHIIYEKQLDIKRENVANCLKKYAGVQVDVNPVVPSKDVYYYRNKAQFPLFEKDGKVCLGFFKEKSHNFVQIDKCYLLGDWCDKFCEAFLKTSNQLKLTCYNEKTHSGLLRHLVLRKLNDKVSVTVVVNAKKFDYAEKFVKELSKIGIKFSFYVSFNTKQTNLIMYNANVFYGDKDIQTDISGVKTFVNPMSFMQINDYIRDAIYSKVKELVIQSSVRIVVDAYSGVGVLTNIVASCADKVYGIEIVPEATANANQLAKLNGKENIIVNICGDSAVELPKLAQQINLQLAHNHTSEVDLCVEKRLNKDICHYSQSQNKNEISSNVKDVLNKQGKTNSINQKDVASIDIENCQSFIEQNYSTTEMSQSKSNQNDCVVDEENAIVSDHKNKTTAEISSCSLSENNVNNKKFIEENKDNFGNFIVILDPPRKGCDMPVLQGLLKAQPVKIIYISCNPATLARDLATLKQNYSISLIQPYDMFPNTSHIETLVCLDRKYFSIVN